MKFEIEDFITKLNTIQCSDSIEFRSRFQKRWLSYLADQDKNTEKELLRLIFEYQKFINSKKQKNESTVQHIDKKKTL
ncbi:hypothetical protein [Paenimyroides viscosum]|uniref:Uncharacterized protein n=1 Tax=Paenimyroides viscosum TaxID=2488729 RepID=A0A3P1AR20_9FLAO|nr:hypothetical protein [Paenimyroides viscosum]RRA90382.1 hypothetical protein EG242_13510 [Paenimyroides viscosum]